MGTCYLRIARMSDNADAIRREFASAWGELGAAWGIAPSTAAVQGYFLTHGGPLTEPEIRRALGLSHRAASLALADCEAWGLIERSDAPRRSGQRGPAATAYLVVGDNWEWFRRVAAARQQRETDPVMPVIERCVTRARSEAADHPGDSELAFLGDRLGGLLRFVREFDRGVGAFTTADAATTARLFGLLGELDEATLQRLLALVGSLPSDELATALGTVSRLSPTAVRRLLALSRTPGLARLLGAR